MADNAFQLAGLWFWYHEDAPVLRGVDLSVPRGQFLALVGANGSGKTTLIKHLNGLLRPCRGRVSVDGRDSAGRSIASLAREVGYLFQHPEQQIFGATVREELAFGPCNLGLPLPEVESRVESALNRFDLAAVAEQPPAILSYGLRRRVTLAALAAMDPPILVLDEPSVGLDLPSLQETFGWLAECRERGKTIVLVTHDMGLAAEHADRLVVLCEGQILADGPPIELFQQGDLLARASLAPPPIVTLIQGLRGYRLPDIAPTVAAFCAEYAAQVEARREPAL